MIDQASFKSVEDFRSRLRQIVDQRDDADIKARDFGEAPQAVEAVLTDRKVSYRVFTSKRVGIPTVAVVGSVALLSEAIPLATAVAFAPAMGVLGVIGIVGFAAIAAHRLLTHDPDYEVEKYPLSNEISLRFKRRVDVSST